MPATSILPQPAASLPHKLVEARCRLAFIVVGALLSAALSAHLVLIFWAQNELTPVESIVALHANRLVTGQGLYFDLQHYPATISAYGPLFYGSSALLQVAGLAPLLSGRLLSFAAFLVGLGCLWQILRTCVANPYARWAGLLLAATTENISFWGTVGQTDMLAVCFSLGAFAAFLNWREHPATRTLIASGLFVLLAVFTKQTSLAAPAAIAVCLLFSHRRTGLWWIATLLSAALGVVLLLQAATHGHYLQNALYANINPFSLDKLIQHVRYFVLTCGGVLLILACGLRAPSRSLRPLYLYTVLAAATWLLTAPKVGSDLNYQIETMLLIAVCAAAALDRLDFFPLLFRQSRVWVTLLNIPLLLHVVLNLVLTVNVLASRIILEPQKAAESGALRPYLHASVLTSQFNALAVAGQRIDAHPLMYDLLYSMLVNDGRIDVQPLLQDLRLHRFQAIILTQDILKPPLASSRDETVSFPPAVLAEMRANYTLVAHVQDPFFEGDYVYAPRRP